MTETEPQYKWVPVTAADEWWLLPVEEVRCDDYRVLHMWHSGLDTSWPIAVIHEGCTIPKTHWHHPESVQITRRVRVERAPEIDLSAVSNSNELTKLLSAMMYEVAAIAPTAFEKVDVVKALLIASRIESSVVTKIGGGE